MKKYFGVLFLVGMLVSQLSSAGTIPLRQVPPLFQVSVFQSEVNPLHYLILGKDQNYANAGNWYVLNWENRIITSPTLKKDSFHYFGGGFDFRFESGEWLYVPGGNSRPGAPGALLEVLGPGLIHPRGGREALRSVSVDEALLGRLGILGMISSEDI